jgi:phage host-nuclease inhibitor protein Gam
MKTLRIQTPQTLGYQRNNQAFFRIKRCENTEGGKTKTLIYLFATGIIADTLPNFECRFW